MRLNTSAINQAWTHDALIDNQEFTLSDVLSRLPELMQQYARWRSDGRCAIGGIEKDCPLGSVTIVMNKKWDMMSIDYDQVKRVVEHLDVLDIQEASDVWRVSIRIPPSEIASERSIPGVWDYVSSDYLGIGSLCLVSRYPGGWFGSKPVTLFMLAYFLGMLARYFPSRWTSLVRNHGNDAAVPTLLSAMDTIEKQFPQIVADFLERSTSSN
jgi:YaaC-like Protein